MPVGAAWSRDRQQYSIDTRRSALKLRTADESTWLENALTRGLANARGQKWRSRPLPKFMVGPNAINGRQRRFPGVIVHRLDQVHLGQHYLGQHFETAPQFSANTVSAAFRADILRLAFGRFWP